MKKILYIDDDRIDQMAFRRYMRAYADEFEIAVVASYTAFDQLPDKTAFDLIITDFHLGDGTALDVIHQFENRRLIILSGTNHQLVAKEQMGSNEVAQFSKPLAEDFIQHIRQLLSEAMEEAEVFALDFSYLEQVAGNDEDFRQDVLKLIQDSTPDILETLQKAVKANDLKEVSFWAHRLKSSAQMLNPRLRDRLDGIEQAAKKGEVLGLPARFETVYQNFKQALAEIKTLLNR